MANLATMPASPHPAEAEDPIGHTDPLLRTALDAADAAGAVLHRWSGRVGMDGAEAKGFGDFVTRADVEAQEAALRVIRHHHPGHRILAEEDEEGTDGGDPRREAERPGPDPATGSPEPEHLWVVDPLDGTTNFLHRHPAYAVSVAVARGGRPVAAAVLAPATGERWWAVRGEGAWKNGRRIRVSDTARLADALVGTGFPFKVLELLPRYLVQFRAVLEGGAGIRRAGAAALDLCYLAEGRFDAFWELFLHPWDFAAGALVVEEAGGIMVRPDGEELTLSPGAVAGANSAALLHELLERLRGAGTGPDA